MNDGFRLVLGVLITGMVSVVIYATGNGYGQVMAVPAAFVVGMLVARIGK